MTTQMFSRLRRACGMAHCIAAIQLGACGGDSGESLTSGPTIASVSIGTPMYRQLLTISIVGSQLDAGITVSSTNCANMRLSTAAPFSSSATTAYYQCTPFFDGSALVTVVRDSDGAVLSSTEIIVPLPEVTLRVNNGETVAGDVVIRLRPDKKPQTVNNFLSYVDSGFYVGTIFHFVFPDLVVEGGGYLPFTPDAPRVLKPTNPPIPAEDDRTNHLSNLQWTVAMVHVDDQDRATSQISINLNDNISRDNFGQRGTTVVFGSIVGGKEIVTAMAAAPCARTSYYAFPGCLPFPNVLITGAGQTR